MLRRLTAGLLFVVLVVLNGPVGGADKPEPAGPLAWKFKKGDKFYQEMYTETKQKMDVTKTEVKQTQKQTFWFSYEVEKVDGSKVTLKQTIKGVKMEIDIGGNTIAYDSTKDAAASNPLADYFKALKDSTFTLTLDTKTMKVEKIEGRDQLLANLQKANPQMKALLDTILSENALKEMAEPTFAVVPTKKGDKSWKRESTLEMGPIGTYKNTYNYTLDPKATKGDVATIKVDTKLEYKQPAEGAQGGLPFKITKASLQSKSTGGTIKFNTKTGRLVESKIDVELSGSLTIEIGGTPTEVKLSQTQTSVVKGIDKLPFTK